MQFTYQQIDALLQEFGESLYLIDLERFKQNSISMLTSFNKYYPRTQLAYSYKTNYLPQICQTADKVGLYAEVVSRMELDLALHYGIPGNRIIFNGPVKAYDDLFHAAKSGVTINVDCVEEIEAISRVRLLINRDIRLGIRCNMPLSKGHHSRFGFDVTSPQFHRAISMLRKITGVHLAGLHCHFSHFRDAKSYGRRTREMLRLSREIFKDAPPEFIDIGGGYCGKVPQIMETQFSGPVPTYSDYAEEIGPVFAEAFPNAEVELILEPGMGVVADTMFFATRIVAKKSIREQDYAVTTGSIYNVKPTFNEINLSVQVLSCQDKASLAKNSLDVVGYTCMEVDVMYRNLEQHVNVGDVLIFSHVGAYTTVLLPPFIRNAPAILSLSANGTVRCLRRTETLADIMATYHVHESSNPSFNTNSNVRSRLDE